MSALAATAWQTAFGDLPVDDGLAMRESATWRYFQAGNYSRFSPLLSVPDLDAFLRTDAARVSRVSMADSSREGSATVPNGEFSSPDGRVELPRLLARFDAGATLIISQFQDMHAPLASLCRGLERAFLHPVQANVYLTPPAAQGFRLHYDTHDVLILQVQGKKKWRIWSGQPVKSPTWRTPWPGTDVMQDLGEPSGVVLGPGDALYLPRGVLHEAETEPGNEASLHVTVGLLGPAWAEAIRLIIDALEVQAEPGTRLRESFPTWRLGNPTAIVAIAGELTTRLAAMASPEWVEHAGLIMMDRLATERLALPGRGLLTSPPKLDETLQLADSMHYYIVPTESGAVLRWALGAESINAEQMLWLHRLEEGSTPAELGEGAHEFCAWLVASGLLSKALLAHRPITNSKQLRPEERLLRVKGIFDSRIMASRALRVDRRSAFSHRCRIPFATPQSFRVRHVQVRPGHQVCCDRVRIIVDQIECPVRVTRRPCV